MPKNPKVDEDQVELVEDLLHEYGLEHLRVRCRGAVLTIESGPKNAAFAHARFRRNTVHLFRLEMPTPSRWEPTPFRGTLEELIDMLMDSFAWTLTSVIEDDPDTTSDPEH